MLFSCRPLRQKIFFITNLATMRLCGVPKKLLKIFLLQPCQKPILRVSSYRGEILSRLCVFWSWWSWNDWVVWKTECQLALYNPKLCRAVFDPTPKPQPKARSPPIPFSVSSFHLRPKREMRRLFNLLPFTLVPLGGFRTS